MSMKLRSVPHWKTGMENFSKSLTESGALYLSVFEQPASRVFFSVLLEEGEGFRAHGARGRVRECKSWRDVIISPAFTVLARRSYAIFLTSSVRAGTTLKRSSTTP